MGSVSPGSGREGSIGTHAQRRNQLDPRDHYGKGKRSTAHRDNSDFPGATDGGTSGKADALRNLLEAVKGVRVDADTTVENFITKNDIVMTRVSGIVKGATEVDKRYLSDGGVEVTVAVYLTGELLAVMLQELPPLTTPLMPAPTIPFIDKPLPPSRPDPATESRRLPGNGQESTSASPGKESDSAPCGAKKK